ncbi:type I restriction endonuclease subunit R [Microbacterium aurantiacum]|uniref:Type I restriction enzyme endonuclease subunit n=1 Tax=Microbacterium aurantiacum TaxID=162393 RepID=A0A0M8MPL3_9MICO|nr:type I restriction endonuclease subunit R [Microbacterium chocolatum]ANG85318.1 DEAD/DEAH box helicase [Microbacterium chocolatum]KOS11061.1 DEAD/DEAH box helicase [Microbacterium chocolatum]
MTALSEAAWEQDALDILAEPLGWRPAKGEEIAPGSGERDTWDDLLIRPRLLEAMRRLNPGVPAEYLQQAVAEIAAPTSQDAVTENHRIHQYLVGGYPLSYIDADGVEQNPRLRLIGTQPHENDWLAVNQVTLRQGDLHRRFDIVLFVNGMPLSIVELKRAGSASTGVAPAHAQLQTYLREFPMAFRFCALTLASDGLEAKYGTPFTPLNHFAPWNVDDDGAPLAQPRLENGMSVEPIDDALNGLYNQERFLQLVRSFTAFDENSDGLTKRIAKPHQYFAVTKAVGSTVQAVETNGKAGVVWHTQGSGKSMEMELYANLVSRHPKLKNPTVIVVTDRTELDGQLFQTFDQSLLLAEKPVQVRERAQLREELSNRITGGIYFTTLQKFGLTEAEKQSGTQHPLLTDRRNVIVVVDEAHRSHYDDLDGYARHLRDALPNATLIAFTGTPISFAERDTRAVFGDYIDIYDLTRAVDDGATVPVYFEPRLIKVSFADGATQENIDRAADEYTLGLDDTERARLEASVAVVNAVYGAPERIEALAADLVQHWEERRERMKPFLESPGKALIVSGTREICARLYAAIVALRPDWHSDALDSGRIKVVYSGSASDQPPVSDHVRRESENKAIKARLKDADDELELVIVKDMMLTGFDAPPLHTLYLDRPLKGALLMQTLARVNRTFKGKQDGLLVAYAPLADNLAQALSEYTVSDQENRPIGRDVDEAVAIATELVAQIREMLAGCDWRALVREGGSRAWRTAATTATNYLRDTANPLNAEHLGSERLAPRYRTATGQLARAWALASGRAGLAELHDEIAFYEEVRVWMAKFDAAERQSRDEPIPEEISRLLGALVAESIAPGDVLDIYDAAGLPRLALDDLGPEFLAKAQAAPNAHLAIEALRKSLTDAGSAAARGNLVRQRAFSERIAEIMNRYTNQQLTSAEVIAELVELAKDVAAEASRGSTFSPPLSSDELAFYDAVATNESAVDVQGEDVLAQIARELVAVMRRDVRTDWTVRDDVRAKLRSSIKRLLVKYKYPPDKQPEAIKLVMDQMESMAPRYAGDRRASDS